MTGLDRIKILRHLSEKNSAWVHKDIFRILRNEDIWVLAYENLKGNKGSLTPGVTPSTMDGMNMDRLRRLQQAVLAEKYEFNPVKQVMIPKPNGKLRPLGLPTANDKIVQEVIRMLLEAIYEPIFDKRSFGFRPNRGCHHALKHVEQTFRWVDYIIEGDIEGAYPTIDHRILCNLIKNRVTDSRFLNLITKSLNCGVMDKGLCTYSSIGVPQGSIVSPILSNIYFHELDVWVTNKGKEINSPASKQKSLEWKQSQYKIASTSKKMQSLDKSSLEYKVLLKELKAHRLLRSSLSSQKSQRIELVYVRYADDWMIGIAGSKLLAEQVKKEVTEFFSTTLQQSLNPSKTKLTNLRHGKASFLGYELFLPANRPTSKVTSKGTTTIKRNNPMLRFDVPVDKIVNRLIEKGYAYRTTLGVRPSSRARYTTLQDHVIVSHFKSVYQGLSNYYSGCTNLSRLQYIHYLLHMSCAMTLAHRHRCSSAQIFKKHGKFITVSIPTPDTGGSKKRSVSFPYRSGWSIIDRKWLINVRTVDPFAISANTVSRSQLNQSCSVCNSFIKVEMHHVKHIRKRGFSYSGFTKEMALINRKQIPLCRECHMKVHKGLLDGSISLRGLVEKNESDVLSS